MLNYQRVVKAQLNMFKSMGGLTILATSEMIAEAGLCLCHVLCQFNVPVPCYEKTELRRQGGPLKLELSWFATNIEFMECLW